MAGSAALAMTLALAACVHTPLPELNPVVPLQWRHALSEQAVPTDMHGWWHDFHDDALDALVERALTDNQALAQAIARLRAARALHSQDNARYLPYVRGFTEDAIDPGAAASYLMAGFDATWEWGLFGRREGTQRALQGQLDVATASLEAVKVSLVGEVVADWLALGAAHERAGLLTTARDLREQQLKLLLVRESLGLGADTPVAEAQSALAHANSMLLLTQGQIDTLSQQLAVLLGRAQPEAAWLASGTLPRLSPGTILATPADLLRTRPEIRRAEAEVLQAAGAANLAHAEQLPNIGIGGSIVWSTNISRNLPVDAFSISSWGPIIEIPLFDWGLRRAQSREKAYLLDAAVFAYRQSVLEAVAEVEIDLGNLQRQREREQQDTLALAAANRASEKAAQRVALSLASPLDQHLATLSQIDQQLALLDASTERGVAYVALFKALGGAPVPNAQDVH